MKCPRCLRVNDPGAKVCAECASPLTTTCAHCGHQLQPTAKFCSECGRPTGLLTDSADDSADSQSGLGSPGSHTPAHLAKRILESKSALEGERKQITILFADLKGSMELLAERDPEDARKLLAPVLAHMMEAVHYYEGTVNQVAGDGIMALFGAPVAHEDHAVRACYAALRMQERVKRHAADVFHTHGVNIQIRVGVNSGEVVVGTVGSDLRMDYTAVGRTTHLAARMEQLASPGTILLTPSTHKLVEPFVTMKALGPVPVKGLADVLEVYELAGEAPPRHHFQTGTNATEFVGRHDELIRLERSLERTAAGDDCLVVVEAEAGVGKSRLCLEFLERCRARRIPVLSSRAFAHSRALPYAPAIDAAKAGYGIAQDDPPELAREKVRRRLAKTDPGSDTSASLLFDFLGIAEPGAERPNLDPLTRREQLHGMFHSLMRAVAARRPGAGVMLLEDVHWLDEASESMVEVFLDAVRGTGTLFVVNCRPGYSAKWMEGRGAETISLAPLGSTDADRLAASLLGSDHSVAPLLPLIADRARGNPLFIEELVRQLAGSGHLSGEGGAYRLSGVPDIRLIPDTVQAIIGARIDRQSDSEKSILQAAAIVGRDFSLPVLARITGKPEGELGAALRRLADAGLVAAAGTMFGFTHPMVQEVAYGSMLSERRRILHAAVAAELERGLLDPDGTKASLIAHHWEEAANPRQAASSYAKAATWYGTPDPTRPLAWHGTRDPARAFDAWKQTRRLLIGLPLEEHEKLQLVWACGQIINMGWRGQTLTAADAEQYYAEVIEGARSLGETRPIGLITLAYARLHEINGSVASAAAVTSKVLATLDSAKDASLQVLMMAGLAYFLRLAGDLPRALQTIDEALARIHEVDEIDKEIYGFSLHGFAKSVRGRILTMMGRCDEARLQLDELCHSDETFIRLQGHIGSIELAWGLNDVDEASAHLDVMTQLAESSGNRVWSAAGLRHTVLIQLMRGEYDLAINSLSNKSLRRIAEAGESRMLADLAYAQLCLGLNDEARVTADEAIAVARRRGTKIMHAYAEWVKGGPEAPAFKTLVAETGAELLMKLQHPNSGTRFTSS